MAITNTAIQSHSFLAGMYADDYFPNNCVEQVKQVLLTLCESIEREQPTNLDALYQLANTATEAINGLQETFESNDSDLETAARESMAADFAHIATAYGFETADTEAMIASRDW